MNLSSVFDIARTQSCYRSKPPRSLKQAPNWKNVYDVSSEKRDYGKLQQIPNRQEPAPRMEEEEDEEEEKLFPFPEAPSSHRKKPRPLPCWGRGVFRTPISELPDFRDVMELARQAELEVIKAIQYGRGRGRARNRGASSINNQSNFAPDVNMQNIQEQCDAYLPNWNSTGNTQKKPMRSPRSRPMLSNNHSQDFYKETTSSDHDSITDELSGLQTGSEFPPTPPEIVSEITSIRQSSITRDYRSSLENSTSMDDGDKMTFPVFPNGAGDSFVPSGIQGLSSSDDCDDSPTTDELSQENSKSHTSSSSQLASTGPSTPSKNSAKSSSTAKNRDSLMLNESTSLNGDIGDLPLLKSSTTSIYSSCNSVQSSKLSEKSASSGCIDQTAIATAENVAQSSSKDDIINHILIASEESHNRPENTPRSTGNAVNSEVAPLDDVLNSLSSPTIKYVKPDISPPHHSSPKKSRKTKPKNDFAFESRSPRKAFVPNIRDSISSSSSTEENFARKCRNVEDDIPKWDPTISYDKGPSTWNIQEDFPTLSSSSSKPSADASAVNVSKNESFVFLPAEYSLNRPRTEPTYDLTGFLQVMSGAKNYPIEKTYKVMVDNIPNGISKQDIELVVKDHNIKVFNITLETVGNFQQAIVQCDKSDLVEIFNGTSPFGASGEDLRCKLL